MKHIFLDTKVIIDVLADREPFSNIASKLPEYGDKGKFNVYISALSYSNIYYTLHKTCSLQSNDFLIQRHSGYFNNNGCDLRYYQ